MKRNMVISALIGALATYLPFWQWESTFQQLFGMFACGIVAFVILLATENEKGSHERQLKGNQ